MKTKIPAFLFCVFCITTLHAQQAPYWRHALGGAVIGAPAAQVESVAAVCDGGNVQAYSREGRELWNFNAQGRLTPFITRSREGTSYICRTNGLLIALNRVGQELWRVNLGAPITSPVQVGFDGRIFVPTASRIACYTASGFPLWSKPLTQPLGLPLQLDKQGGLLAIQNDGELLVLNAFGKALSRRLSETPALFIALDTPAAESLAPEATEAAAEAFKAAVAEAAKTAEEAAKAAAVAREAAEKAAAAAKAAPDNQAAQNTAAQARGAAEAAARLAGEKATAAADIASKFPPVFTGAETTLLVVYKTGKAETIRWTRSEQSFALAFPALAAAPLAVASRGDKLGMALANGKVSLYSVGEKRSLWSGDSHIANSDTPAESSLIYDERGLYALSKSGATGYFEDGKQHWLQRIQDAKSPPAFSDEGILYSGGNDWVLYAYHLEDTIKTQRQSIYGPAPEGSYGTGNPRPSPWAEDFNRYEEREIRDRLERISTAAREGRLGENERSYAAYLMEIAGSIADAPMNQSPLHPLIHVNYRVEAARLLAYMGSRETIPFLAGLCRSDPDPLVKAAAAEAIGYIGVDPDGIALAAFRSMIFPLIPNRDERVLAAVAAATGSLCRFSGPPLSEAGIRLLSAVADIGPAFAQAVARKELQSLR
ncbi:hypothetical protein TREPR_2610 [Treponema primitia ZAS-2]|uniref:Pyrrolo-quinoline quinone repeat domain-containing protein n=1 Tax=Treponema primitia (strain ATCC BAA-887 / DSM 12427 / ZAS-2) TaxID=545694 RepID=F5YGH8_TREPZ|nr:PQQ-binding-like beta-propeller repeat protein [Treponema primitia]AEF84283.1 hypothetical protein TREPR_2610 [Treponema primitia ZAS-2]